MHATHALFSAEEAFTRLGQTRAEGCLVIVSEKETSRIFTKDGFVVNAYREGKEGLFALENAFGEIASSYVWIPESKPPREAFQIAINSHVLKNALAKDVHFAKTAKVKLDSVQLQPPGQTSGQTESPRKKAINFYLVAKDLPGQKFPIDRSAMIIGREESCDLVFLNAQVSRRHCILQLIVRGLTFRDLDSTNGIFVNGIHAQEGLLEPGDQLSLGSFSLSVHREGDEGF